MVADAEIFFDRFLSLAALFFVCIYYRGSELSTDFFVCVSSMNIATMFMFIPMHWVDGDYIACNTAVAIMMQQSAAAVMMSNLVITHFGSVPPKSTALICVGTINPIQRRRATVYAFAVLFMFAKMIARTIVVTTVLSICTAKRGGIFFIISFCFSLGTLSKP